MADREIYDVIVVGAGPAGAMAACHAAKGGCRVALLERKGKAGVPVRCGEAVGFKGFTKSITIKDEWIQTRIKKIRMISPSGHAVDLINPSRIGDNYIIDREIMDNDLVQQAVNTGVSYFASTPIMSVTSESGQLYKCVGLEKEFFATCVILADGVESKLARDLGWNSVLSMEDIETCAFCHVEHDSIAEDTIEFHVGSAIAPCGFLWIFPRRKGKANVGLGVLGTKSNGGKVRELLNDFIGRNFQNAKVSNLHCGGAPVGKWLKPLVRGGAMVVGDAARQVNSLSGGGIAYALYAGRIAGETVAEAFKNGAVDYTHLKQYQKKWASYCGKQQLRSYALKSMLLKKDNDTFYDTVAKSLMREDPDTLNYTRVFMRVFSRHPLILLKTFFLFR